MAKSANLYARIEPDIKEQAEAILSALGIPASNAITMFYKQIILQKGLPFEVKLPVGQLDRLEESILSPDQMPDRYRAYEKEPWHSRGLRVMPVDKYLVFYIPNHDAKVVNIFRVMDGGRDIGAQLTRFMKT